MFSKESARNMMELLIRNRCQVASRYMIVDPNNGMSQPFRDMVVNGDPVAACHPAVVISADLMWSGLACYTFITSKWLAPKSVRRRLKGGDLGLQRPISLSKCRFSLEFEWVFEVTEVV